MRIVPQSVTDIWKSGDFTGPNRPVARVTLQRTDFITKDHRNQRYASYLFANPHKVLELPNVRDVKWNRSTDSDAGSCIITLWNASPRRLGSAPDPADMVPDQRGFYTVNRGDETNPWNHVKNYMNHRMYPDMLIRTYEGFGCDPDLPPELDPNQFASGVWLIDDVELTADGTIQLACRDAARLLIEQIAFPPVVPFAAYPLEFDRWHKVDKPKVPVVSESNSQGWVRPDYQTDSGIPYYGTNGSIYGHRPTDAMDNDGSSYWLSVGNSSPTAGYSFEYVQGKIDSGTVSGFKIKVKGGPYRVYLSVYADGEWKGNGKVPYDPDNPVSAPNGADIKFVKSGHCDRDDTTIIGINHAIENATRVRITFTDLWNSGIGPYPYRAAVKDFQVLVGETEKKTTYVDGGYRWKGNYNDYTDVVKLLLAYGGFFWPGHSRLNWLMDTRGIKTHYTPLSMWVDRVDDDNIVMVPGGDPVLLGRNPEWTHDHVVAGGNEIGAVWADLEQTGTYGDVRLTPDVFDKKPLMDGIAYVRDLTGMIFFIDETGAAIMRSPNIWKKGNWLYDPESVRTVGRTTNFVTIHEKQTLMALQAQMSSRNTRERYVIANVGGNKGAVTKGFRPYNLPRAGLRRVAIWSDQHFKDNENCQIMADLVAIRALFSYRTDRITIPGYPALQIDDQVKLVESTTEENKDLHYVKGISSSLSHDSGEWTYEIDTHWLGSDPFGDWAFNPDNQLSEATRAYLRALGRID